jgi:hypothetical protein
MDIDIIHQVWTDWENGHRLEFHWCRYPFPQGEEYGYRFMWRSEERGLITDRGQARIPSAALMFELIRRATEARWFVRAEQASN